MSYANIKGAWRTRKQALNHILTELVGGRLGATTSSDGRYWNVGCSYESLDKGIVRHCGVGCLFNEAQIRSIKSRGLNGMTIDEVAEVIGEKNITTVTGLHLTELDTIQCIHDDEWAHIQETPKDTKLYKYLTLALGKARV
jgi:hypothetical protein